MIAFSPSKAISGEQKGLEDVANIREIGISPDGRYMDLKTPTRTFHLFRLPTTLLT